MEKMGKRTGKPRLLKAASRVNTHEGMRHLRLIQSAENFNVSLSLARDWKRGNARLRVHARNAFPAKLADKICGKIVSGEIFLVGSGGKPDYLVVPNGFLKKKQRTALGDVWKTAMRTNLKILVVEERRLQRILGTLPKIRAH